MFGDTFREALIPSSAPGAMEPTPRRKQRAIDRAEKLEAVWLTDKQMVRLINIFRVDCQAVDAYMTVHKESLRKCWVATELGIEGLDID